MTITETWPEQLRLPGQTAAHPGPIDMSGMYLMHHAFRRDLADFAAAAVATPVTARDCWGALGKRWELFSEALHHHHTGEDAGLWPVLEARTDDAGRATLAAMEAEHAELDGLLRSCGEGFARLAETPDEDARAALAVHLVATRERIGEHLRHEEVDAIAIMQQTMTQAEWEAIEKEHFQKGVPLSRVLALVPWVARGLPRAARTAIFDAPGGRVYRVMWLLTRRGFERRHRAAFAYVG